MGRKSFNHYGKRTISKFGYLFSCLRDKVHTVYPILLKLAQIVRIIIDINPIANEENLLDSFGRREI